MAAPGLDTTLAAASAAPPPAPSPLAAARPAAAGRRPGERRGRRYHRPHAGFTYFGVLFILVLMSLGLGGAAQLWATADQRARERELLWVGNQYVKALRSYHKRSPGIKTYPRSLDELLEDRRFPMPVRHLRQRYRDPITRLDEWGLVKNADGRIAGVYSLSAERPRKQGNFPAAWDEFADAADYGGWRFIADDALRPARPAERRK